MKINTKYYLGIKSSLENRMATIRIGMKRTGVKLGVRDYREDMMQRLDHRTKNCNRNGILASLVLSPASTSQWPIFTVVQYTRLEMAQIWILNC
jgi:hypothetical protein